MVLHLNCEDLPEAGVYPLGRGPTSYKNWSAIPRTRSLNRNPKNSKPRKKLVGLPVVSEVENDSSNLYIIDVESQQWSCKSCTLLNSNLLSRCEACDRNRTDKAMQSHQQELPAAPSLGTFSLDWPALPDASEVVDPWIDCDVSSVASSWLDIGGADGQGTDDNESDIVLVGASAAQTQVSEAASWSAIVGKTEMLNIAAIRRVPLPPFRRLSNRTRTNSADNEGAEWDDDSDDDDVALNVLHERRMNGTGNYRNVRQNKVTKKKK